MRVRNEAALYTYNYNYLHSYMKTIHPRITTQLNVHETIHHELRLTRLNVYETIHHELRRR